MMYQEYPDIAQTYVVHHTVGFGDQGGEPYRIREVVFWTDSLEQAETWGKTAYPRDPSGWTYDSYAIAVNTNTEQGKLLYDAYLVEAKKRQAAFEADRAAHPERYTEYHGTSEDGEPFTIVMQNNDLFDAPTDRSEGFPTASYRMLFLDQDENNKEDKDV